MDLKRKFVSQDEIDEKKQKRQEEWEKVRKAEDPKEAPEDEYDPRSLYDRLQEQKVKKQEEYDAQHQFKNQIRGIDEGESEFLEFVSSKQVELEKEREKEEKELLQEYKETVVNRLTSDSKPGTSKLTGGSKSLPSGKLTKKSQAEILAGAIRKKGGTDGASKAAVEGHLAADQGEKRSTEEPLAETSLPAEGDEEDCGQRQMFLPSALRCIGVLPGMTDYSDSSEDGSSSSSDIDESTSSFSKQTQIKVATTMGTATISKADLKALRSASQ